MLMLKLPEIWTLRASLGWLLCSSDESPNSLSTLLLSGTSCSGLILFFLCPSHFFMESSFLVVENGMYKSRSGIRHALAVGVLLLPDLLVDRDRKCMCMYIHLHVYSFLSILKTMSLYE